MKPEVRSAHIYRDFEKLYRLLGLYSGNLDQLSQQIKFADASLHENLSHESGDPAVKFDFLMTSVFSDGKEVFRSPSPELTMAYALFCEGVRAIVTTEGLTGQELMEWCQLLRKSLSAQSSSGEDLASVLWRHRFSHIKAQIYNALMNVEEVGLETLTGTVAHHLDEQSLDKALEREHLAEGRMSEKIEAATGAHREGSLLKLIEDDKFVLPSGQRFFRTVAQIDSQQMDRLKSSLGDIAYSDKAKALVRFGAEEIQALREELESYNANHVEFNLLVQLFSVVEESDGLDVALQQQLLKRFEVLIKSIVQRFHTGLLSFVVKKLGALKTRAGFEGFTKMSSETIRTALQSEQNKRLLLEALASQDGAPLAIDLLQYYPPQEWPRLLDQVVGLKRPRALQNFLVFVQKYSSDLESQLFSFGPERLKALIPAIAESKWEKRNPFLLRCLQSRSPDVVAACLPYVSRLQLTPHQLLPHLEKLSDSARAKFLETLIDQKRLDEWKGVARILVNLKVWAEGSEFNALSTLKFIVYALGDEALESLEPLIVRRRFVLWPKHPVERERILTALFSVKVISLKSRLKDLYRREASVFFQPSDLKARLTLEGS